MFVCLLQNETKKLIEEPEEPEEINADFDGSLTVNDETMDIVDSNKDEEEELQIEVYIHEK